jgi:site-specific DNA-methyltransferase (adenine-specific)
MAVAIEDAGFEIRDQCIWLYGSGFPKSHNIGDGWGTALKPAHEPMVLARKPLSEKSVSDNVMKHRTGAINIDECRIQGEVKHPNTMPDFRDQGEQSKKAIGVDKLSFGQTSNAKRKKVVRQARSTDGVWTDDNSGMKSEGSEFADADPRGRWPSNVMHDGSEQVQDIFPKTVRIWSGELNDTEQFMPAYGDHGNASRYFYCAKTSKDERKSGLGGEIKANTHPTVKPVELMRYLVRLVTPKGGLVLDPFMGSGSTGMGAREEDFRFIGIEKEREYYEIAKARIKNVKPQLKLFDI